MLKYYIALAIILALLAGAAVVRIRPITPEMWHVAPETVMTKGVRGRFTVTFGGDLDAYTAQGSVADVAIALRTRIEATPRTTLLSGSLEEGFATYVTRSKLWGFPDVTNVKLTKTDAGTQVEMAGRLIYGDADFGVNEARIRDWLAAIKG